MGGATGSAIGGATASRAAHWLRLAADQGHAEAQFLLGTMLQQGLGTQRNLEEAVEWLRQAAAQNHRAAAWSLANAYEMGLGIPSNNAEALRHYRMAAERGDRQAILRLLSAYRDGTLGAARDAGLVRFWEARLAAMDESQASGKTQTASEQGNPNAN